MRANTRLFANVSRLASVFGQSAGAGAMGGPSAAHLGAPHTNLGCVAPCAPPPSGSAARQSDARAFALVRSATALSPARRPPERAGSPPPGHPTTSRGRQEKRRRRGGGPFALADRRRCRRAVAAIAHTLPASRRRRRCLKKVPPPPAGATEDSHTHTHTHCVARKLQQHTTGGALAPRTMSERTLTHTHRGNTRGHTLSARRIYCIVPSLNFAPQITAAKHHSIAKHNPPLLLFIIIIFLIGTNINYYYYYLNLKKHKQASQY